MNIHKFLLHSSHEYGQPHFVINLLIKKLMFYNKTENKNKNKYQWDSNGTSGFLKHHDVLCNLIRRTSHLLHFKVQTAIKQKLITEFCGRVSVCVQNA